MAMRPGLSKELVNELVRVLGKDWVLSAPEDLMLYEYDGAVDRALPQAVVFPRTAEQVSQIVKLAGRYGVPVVPRGAGTGLSGGAIACEGGIVVAMTRMKRILEVDVENRIAVVEPGLVNLDLTKAVSKHKLYYAPDPSSQRACTIGGNVAENAGGPHCLAYGVTANHVLGLEVVLANGDIVWLGGKTLDTPGYDLRGIVIGSEGMLAIVTKVVVRLLRQPEATITLLAVFHSVDEASQCVSDIIARGFLPSALEMIDRATIEAVEPAIHAGYPPDAGAVLLIEVDGLAEAVTEEARDIRSICLEDGAVEVRWAEEQAERDRLWAGRKGAIGALGRLAPNYYIVDGVVPRSKLPAVMKDVFAIADKYGFRVANVFHAGDGNLHPNLLFDESVPGMIERVLEAGEEIMRVCVAAGGSISGEHGVGVEKRTYLPWIFSEDDLEMMRRVRVAFGADKVFNPGKVFPSSKGCGEVSQSAIRAFGPDAYI